MNQSKFQSLVETVTSTLIGYLVSVATNVVVLPLFGFNVSIADSIFIGVCFTTVSIIRSYLVRRWFEAKRVRSINSLLDRTRFVLSDEAYVAFVEALENTKPNDALRKLMTNYNCITLESRARLYEGGQ